MVIRAICAKERISQQLEHMRNEWYTSSNPGLYQSVACSFPWTVIINNKAISKILPHIGRLHEDSSTRPLAKFLAPFKSTTGHENFKIESFSFMLVRPHAIKQSLHRILGRLASTGFEIVALKKCQVNEDMVEDLGACRNDDQTNCAPMLRDMWMKELLENECVVMVVKRINAVYQLYCLAGPENPAENQYTTQHPSKFYMNKQFGMHSNSFNTGMGHGMSHSQGMGGIGHLNNNRPNFYSSPTPATSNLFTHSSSAIKNGPTIRALAGTTMIQNACWVPNTYDDAMTEIKKFFPTGLPVEGLDNRILSNEGLCAPGYDNLIGVNDRCVYQKDKNNLLYPVENGHGRQGYWWFF